MHRAPGKLAVADLAASGRWDYVVVDCASTADAMRMLTLPAAFGMYVERAWPRHRRLSAAVDDARSAAVVALVEGVKDAAALRQALGIKAVGLPTSHMAPTFARLFRDCSVVVIPDRDTAGAEGAEKTAANLFGVAASVKQNTNDERGVGERGGGDKSETDLGAA